MREFDYTSVPNELMNHELMNLISAIHEYKGKQELFIEAKADVLEAMLEIAIIQSTGSSNRIEGIYTSDERLDALVKLKAEPRNRSEREIAGYREVLRLIHESYDYMAPRTNVYYSCIETCTSSVRHLSVVNSKIRIILSLKQMHSANATYALNP